MTETSQIVFGGLLAGGFTLLWVLLARLFKFKSVAVAMIGVVCFLIVAPLCIAYGKLYPMAAAYMVFLVGNFYLISRSSRARRLLLQTEPYGTDRSSQG